ncbi:hypothetical protein [Dehalobacter sp.]|nr:hypothetical protein [Dehalobacter sp.]MDJ0306774.1 hypothetical protein [Dehalobacter sp.]
MDNIGIALGGGKAFGVSMFTVIFVALVIFSAGIFYSKKKEQII